MQAVAGRQVAAGDRVLLLLEDERRFLIEVRPGRSFSTHKGAIDHDTLIGREYGTAVATSSGSHVWLLRPVWTDQMMKVERRTNIMYPKDVGYLLAGLGLGPGDRVVELGTGSGAMTIALTHAVRPGGRVYSYDRRAEFLERAARNCERAGVEADEVVFRERHADEPLEAGVDAVMCDIPEPWAEVDAAAVALVGSGRFAAAVPTYNQAERLAARLIGDRFALVRTVEVLVREILARPGRTRPSHRMIGHTQLLTTAVKVASPADTEDHSAGEDGDSPAGAGLQTGAGEGDSGPDEDN